MSTKKERMLSAYNLINKFDTAYFNLLHGSFSNDGLLDDSISVHLVILGHRSSLILGLTGKNESLRAEEVSVGVDLTNSLLLNTLNLLSSGSSYIIVRKPNSIIIAFEKNNKIP